MILPFFNNTLDLFKYSGTWLFVLLNIFVYVVIMRDQNDYDKLIANLMEDKVFKRAVQEQYASYVTTHREAYGKLENTLASQIKSGRYNNADVMLSLSFRDPDFFWQSAKLSPLHDKVLNESWQRGTQKILDLLQTSPGMRFGVSSSASEAGRFLSYQFIHGGEMHLITNMIFFVVFGINLEMLVGGTFLMLTYLVSGLMGGFVYILLSGLSLAPLVGASAAVYGVMAAYVVLYWKMPVRFIVLFMPREYFYFPAWSILAVLLTIDILGQISHFHGLAGVAHSAHLGGAIAGITIGFILRRIPQVMQARVRFDQPPVAEPKAA